MTRILQVRMSLLPRDRRRSLSVQVALALLAWGGVFAADAGASCGDYVQVLGSAAPMAGHAGPLAPCHGPECSRPDHPLAPPAAPATQAASQSQLDAILSSADLPVPSLSFVVGSETVDVPSTMPSSLFRPPRSR